MTKKIHLYAQKGETSRYIDAEINEAGDLLMLTQDVGQAPQEWWGDSDYEFWVSVPADQKDDLLLAFIKSHYAGEPSAVANFQTFMKAAGIQFSFQTWT